MKIYFILYICISYFVYIYFIFYFISILIFQMNKRLIFKYIEKQKKINVLDILYIESI